MHTNFTNNAKIPTAIVLLFISLRLVAVNFAGKPDYSLLNGVQDTIPPKKVKVNSSEKKEISDTVNHTNDSVKVNTIDTLILSKDSLDAPVKYEAADSGVLKLKTKEFLLYGKANVKYKDLELQAATVEYNSETQLVKAYGALDTTNNPLSKPKLNQGPTTSISDSIIFNMKTMKGITKNTYMKEDEIFVNASVVKKVDSNSFYAYRARFTTCNLDTPHFAIRSRKLKMITNKLAVSGPASPEFEGVPVPIGIPFGIYPLVQGRHSGILVPAFTVSQDFGFGLEGLGYYKVVNDNWDITTRANLYSYGGWTLNVAPKYIKRYHYTGSLSITLQNPKILNTSLVTKDQFTTSKSFMINWNHTQDTRSRPGTTFGASVQFGSTKFNQTLLNNPYQNYQNQLSSSISYSKNFNNKVNLSLNLNHNQNNNTHLVNLNFPTATLSVVTFYPFQKKDKIGTPKWYENIGVGYSGNFSNQISFYDTAGVSFKRLLDTFQYGATHSIPISISLPALGPVTLSPSVSYEERWFGQKIYRTWDTTKNKLDTTIQKGFYTQRQMSFGVTASTRIFGTFNLKHGETKIRHEIRPSIGFSYKPDFVSKYFYNSRVDSFGHTARFSVFDGVLPGGFGEGTFGGISFAIDNLLEMKVKDKKDSTGKATKKIKLLDGFGINGSYNLMADSFALSTFNLYARSTLFEKVNITASATLDPYVVDSLGYRKNIYAWNGPKHNLGSITSGNIAISTSFKSKAKDGKENKDKNIPVDPFLTPDEQQRQLQFARANPAEFTDFDIPWTLSLSYSLTFTKQPKITNGLYSYSNVIYSSANFNGDFSLTPKWKVGSTGYFDFNSGQLQQFSMFITRDMHCWQLSINVTPIGMFRSFSFTISPKSGVLRDLRINRSRSFSSY
ncbi:MAG: LPS-assembly protein LptD [Bacteroidetes bacterium]|nr:LPS-assembly protein LptD [Bacteroidota bacterium]MBS1671512.1 LPS-assembly protein LptD [Bacteroidota bacterium]